MPDSQKPKFLQTFAVPAKVDRLLLLCRFDFRQKVWGFPVWENRRDGVANPPSASAELASALVQKLSKFSYRLNRRAKNSKLASRRMRNAVPARVAKLQPS